MNKTKQQAVILDCDDVLLDFLGHLVSKYNEELPNNTEPLEVSDVLDFSLNSKHGRDLSHFFKQKENKGLYNNIPDEPYARKVTKQLAECGIRVIIATARSEFFMDETQRNLAEHEIHYDELYFTKSKGELVKVLHDVYDVIAFVDDAEHNLVDVDKHKPEQSNMRLYMMDKPTNKNSTKFDRINNLLRLLRPCD